MTKWPGIFLSIFLFVIPAQAKVVVASAMFSFSEPGQPATVPQLLDVSLYNAVQDNSGCSYKMTLQAYDGVVPTSSVDDLHVDVPLEGPCRDIESGIRVSALKDGEYRIFLEATWMNSFGANNAYCFIVRNGLLYGGRFFDDIEEKVILDVARKDGTIENIPLLKKKYKVRLKERERLKKENRKKE